MDDLFSTIINFFPDLTITLSDLQDPKPAFVQYFYERVLIEFCVDTDNLKKPHFRQSQHPLLPQKNLLMGIKYCFPFIDIGLFDLLNPVPQKTIIHMKKVMEFLYFCDSKTEELNSEANHLLKSYHDLKILQGEKELSNQRKNMLALEKNKIHQKMEELDVVLKEKQLQFQEISQKKNMLINQRDEVKAIVQQKEEEVENILGSIKTIESEIEQIRNQFIGKKDKIEPEEIDKLLNKKNMAEEDKAKLWDKIKKKRDVKAQFQRVMDVVGEKFAELEGIQEIFVKYSQLNNEKLSMEKHLQQLRAEIESLSKKLESNECEEQENVAPEVAAAAESKIKLIQETVAEKQKAYTDMVGEVKQVKKEISKYSQASVSYDEQISNMMMDYKSVVDAVNRGKEFNNKKRGDIARTKMQLRNCLALISNMNTEAVKKPEN